MTDEIQYFTQKKLEKLLRTGGYTPHKLKWSYDWCGVGIPGYSGHCTVFHGIFKDVEKSVKKRFGVKINLYLNRTPIVGSCALKSNSGMGMRSFSGGIL